jgi:hypothetical protein
MAAFSTRTRLTLKVYTHRTQREVLSTLSSPPRAGLRRRVTLERRIPLVGDRDNALYICLTQEDGHLVWSSPIYIFR